MKFANAHKKRGKISEKIWENRCTGKMDFELHMENGMENMYLKKMGKLANVIAYVAFQNR